MKTLTWILVILVNGFIIYEQDLGYETSLIISILVYSIGTALLFIWPYIIVRRTLRSSKERKSIFLVSMISIFTMAVAKVTEGFFEFELDFIVAPIIFGALFYAFLKASLALTATEKSKFLVRKSSKTAIFFFLFCFPIGMYFLERRLKALEA